ncbi:MAG: amidohydrolase [Thermostichales cyanobacterium SZTDM-1c_bins_54]
MSWTIRGALVATPTGYERVDVQVTGGRIAALGSGLEGETIEAEGCLLLPGLVNAHTHSLEVWTRGLIGPLPLELWLAELYDLVPVTPEKVYWSALATGVDTLLSGGTALVDHLVLLPGQEEETLAAACRAYRQLGIRAFVAPLVQDLPLPAAMPQGGMGRDWGSYLRPREETLQLLRHLIQTFHRPEEGITLLLGPTGMQLCTDEFFLGCVELSREFNLGRHTHLLETRAQMLLAQEKYGGSAVAHLHKLGFLDRRTSLAHCVWLTPEDTEILAATGATVVHNPLSNLRLGSGIAPVLKYRQAGVNVTFGCDGSASNDGQDLLEAIKIGSLLHNITDPDYRHWLTAYQSLHMASSGAAKGLGEDHDWGSLAVGQAADLLLCDLTHLSLLPQTDPLQLLFWGRPVGVVKHSWVKGQPVVRNGIPVGCDLEELRRALWQYSQGVVSPSHRTLHQIEPHYRQVMGLDP